MWSKMCDNNFLNYQGRFSEALRIAFLFALSILPSLEWRLKVFVFVLLQFNCATCEYPPQMSLKELSIDYDEVSRYSLIP